MHRALAAAAMAGLAAVVLWPAAGSSARAQERAALEDHAWAVDTAWANAIEWMERQLESCRTAQSYAAQPCDRFIGEALDRVYGIAEFRDGDGYLGMSSVLNAVKSGQSAWQVLGTGDDQAAIDAAQARANAGDPVVAALATPSGGHVAFVLPGETMPSSSWRRSVPNSASFFISSSERSYIAKGLSFSFDGRSASAVTFYSRSRPSAAEAAEAADGGQRRPVSLGTEAAAAMTAYLEAPVETAKAAATPVEPPSADAPAPVQANPAKADEPRFAAGTERVFGMWCETGGDDPRRIRAVLINDKRGTLSWGHVDGTRANAFDGELSRPIVKIERNGAIISVSFAQSDESTADATAFFVVDGDDRLFESHIFDHAKSEIRAKDLILERCSARRQTAGG